MGIDAKYIKLKVEGLAGGTSWVFKMPDQNGTLVHDPDKATVFAEAEAFELRKKIIAQLPETCKVVFDLRG